MSEGQACAPEKEVPVFLVRSILRTSYYGTGNGQRVPPQSTWLVPGTTRRARGSREDADEEQYHEYKH